jgi:hypothetical protein
MERFLGDGGTGKRQYTAEAKSYSVVVKKPVCNVILNSSPRDWSVIYERITTRPERNRNAAWQSPAMRKCGRMRSTTPHIPTTTYLPRRLQNTCRDASKMSSFVDDTSSLTILTATRSGTRTSEPAEAAEASTSPVGGKQKRKRTSWVWTYDMARRCRSMELHIGSVRSAKIAPNPSSIRFLLERVPQPYI